MGARSAYLQSDNLSRLLLLRMPRQHPPPGCLPEQILVALGSIYGTRDAGRGFYLHAKRFLSSLGLAELCLEKACYAFPGAHGPRLVMRTHVGDFLVAGDGSKEMEVLREKIRAYLHMKTADRTCFTYRGIHVRVKDKQFEVGQPIAARAIGQLSVPGDPERLLTPEEQTDYRGLVGRPMWLQSQTRPDLSCGTSWAARRGTGAGGGPSHSPAGSSQEIPPGSTA